MSLVTGATAADEWCSSGGSREGDIPLVKHGHDPALHDVLSYHRPAAWIESLASMDWAVEAILDLHAAVSMGQRAS